MDAETQRVSSPGRPATHDPAASDSLGTSSAEGDDVSDITESDERDREGQGLVTFTSIDEHANFGQPSKPTGFLGRLFAPSRRLLNTFYSAIPGGSGSTYTQDHPHHGHDNDDDNDDDHHHLHHLLHYVEPPARTSLGQYVRSFRHALFASRLNVLLIFVPAGTVTYLTRAPPVAVFITNAIAIVPLSALLTDATERIAADAGDTVGALLNISLGNLVELILFIVALANGHTRIVEASILGSILVNILLILGSALLACSVLGMDTTYTTAGTQVLGSLLFVSVFAFLMPTAFEYAFDQSADVHNDTLKMSRITACVVLAIYVLYVVHELQAPVKTAAALHMKVQDLEASSAEPETTQVPAHTQQNTPGAGTHPLPPRTIRFADENLVDTADGPTPVSARTSTECTKPLESGTDTTQNSFGIETERGRSSFTAARTAATSAYRQSLSRGRSFSLTSLNGRPSRDSSLGSEGCRAIPRSALPTMRTMRSYDDEAFVDLAEGLPHHTTRAIERTVAILILVVSSGIMSMNAEFLVSTIDQITHEGHLSESLIGLIILPIVGNMAEYITVVTVACREKLDLAVAVSVGSSIQIALCVAPLTVMAGWVLGAELMLTFDFFEMAALMGTVLLVNIIILSESSGGARSNALRGGLICGSYAIITIGAYLAPSEEEN